MAPKTDDEALAKLVENEGFADFEALGEEFICDSLCPAICMNEGCEYTVHYEPDSTRGWCEMCETNTVVSAFILAGVI